jgi:hypothetical protein
MTNPGAPASAADHIEGGRDAQLADLGGAARELLVGAIDMHAHAAPDPFAERRMDARELVQLAREAGMAGLVLKCHEIPTQLLAWALQPEVPELRIVGSIALDRPLGGVNPDAVDAALRIGTRVVWMPTFDTAWSRERFGRWHSRQGPVAVLDEAERLLSECEVVLELIAEHDAVLCTGHLSPLETRILVREARRRSIRTIVTHATSFSIPLEVQQEAASLGAYVEQCGVNMFRPGGLEAYDAIRRDVRAVGSERVILSTDLGQAPNPPPPVGFGLMMERFLDGGFSVEEVRRMTRDNPLAVLGAAE